MKWLAPLEEINTLGKSLFYSLIDYSREELVNIHCAHASGCAQTGEADAKWQSNGFFSRARTSQDRGYTAEAWTSHE